MTVGWRCEKRVSGDSCEDFVQETARTVIEVMHKNYDKMTLEDIQTPRRCDAGIDVAPLQSDHQRYVFGGCGNKKTAH